MYYELYIDVLFLQNVFMDSLVLMSVNHIMKGNASFLRNFLGGAAGSALTCIVAAVPIPVGIKPLLFHTVVNTAMLFAGLKIKNGFSFAKAMALLYIVSLLYGGIFSLFYPYIRRAGLFFTTAVCSYYAVRWIWDFSARQRDIRRRSCTVTLYTKRGEKQVKALIDTGNVLTDALTGKPVSVIDLNTAKCIFGEKEIKEGFRLVPYHTVGREGVLPVFCIEKMYIHNKLGISVEKPLIGVGGGEMTGKGEYEMILNSDLAGGIQDVY